MSLRHGFQIWTALLLSASACSSTPAPVPSTAPSATPSAAAAKPKGEPHASVIWKQRIGHEDIPQVNQLLANAAGDLLIGAGASGAALVFRFDAADRFLGRTTINTYRGWLGGAALDTDGSSYATAWFDTEVTMGGHSISGSVASSVFFLKLDGEGKRVWSKVLEGNKVEDPELFLGPKGDLFLGGCFATDLHLGGTTLPGRAPAPGAHSGNLFLARYDAAGSVKWSREILADGFFTSIVADGSGQLLVAGDFWDSVAFDAASPMKSEKRSGDPRDHFLAKLDATGRVRWARHLEAQQIVLAPDASGDAYICGLPGSGPSEVKKISADGRVLLKAALPEHGPACGGLTADDQGMIYVAGRSDDGPPSPDTGEATVVGHVVKIDGSTGKIVSGLPLFPDFSVTPGPQILWSKGRLFVAGVGGKYKDPWLYLAELTL